MRNRIQKAEVTKEMGEVYQSFTWKISTVYTEQEQLYACSHMGPQRTLGQIFKVLHDFSMSSYPRVTSHLHTTAHFFTDVDSSLLQAISCCFQSSASGRRVLWQCLSNMFPCWLWVPWVERSILNGVMRRRIKYSLHKDDAQINRKITQSEQEKTLAIILPAGGSWAFMEENVTAERIGLQQREQPNVEIFFYLLEIF